MLDKMIRVYILFI